MESSPSYSSDDPDANRRSGKERPYQPPAPESVFAAPPRAPLEGVIHIRPIASEAVYSHMQQQAEVAKDDEDDDKDDEKKDRKYSEADVADTHADTAAYSTESAILPTIESQPPVEIETDQAPEPEAEPMLESYESQEAPMAFTENKADAFAAAEQFTTAYAPEQETIRDTAPPTDDTGRQAWFYDSQPATPAGQQAQEYAPASVPAAENYIPVTESRPDNPLFVARTDTVAAAYRQGAYEAPSPFDSSPVSNLPPPPRTPGGPGFPDNPFDRAQYDYYPADARAGSPSQRLAELLPMPSPQEHTHRGLAMGIVGGLLVEHLLSKNRDKKLGKQISAVREETARMQMPTSAAERPVFNMPAEVEVRHGFNAAPVPVYAPSANRAPAGAPYERVVPPQTREQQLPGQGQEYQEYIDQQGSPIHLRPGERVQHSTWHTYVEKNGHAVDAIEYGQGFHQEQQELGRGPQFDDGHSPAGQVQGSGWQPANPSLPSGMTVPGLPTGQPTHADAQHQLPERTKSGKQQILSNFTNPWFWVMLVLIFAAFYIAATV